MIIYLRNVNEMFGKEAFDDIKQTAEKDLENIPTVWILDPCLIFSAATIR